MAEDAAVTDNAGPLPCNPCSGSGSLISRVGGEEQRVPCPWCEGSGVFLRGHDAQAARRGDGATPGAAAPDGG
ncbi:unannotated protein [freshwater metagenome]|uniref:Unannotated protein n=1 Tax=freshwater metagenome TaxID=449393 RepID=A0A6J7EMG8_9ZZZZ|nr:hypothetical protein [Actinomycetota bacterium]